MRRRARRTVSTTKQLGASRWPWQRWTTTHWLLALLATSLCASVLALGGSRMGWMLASMPVPVVAALLGVRLAGRLPPPALVMLALAGYCVLQALPFPFGVVAAIAPANAETWTRALEGFSDAAPAWISLSLDPGATWVEAFKWTLYAGLFAAAAHYAERARAQHVALALFLSGIAIVLIGLAHGAVGAERLYGIYEPTFRPTRFGMTPLLNPNNLAGYLNLAIFAGVALMVSSHCPVPRQLVLAGTGVLVAYSALTASRAGFAALILGVVGFIAVAKLRRTKFSLGGSQARLFAGLLAALFVAATLAALGGDSETWKDLTGTSVDKLQVLKWTLPMIEEFPWFGVGRGAFATTFPAYRQAPGHVTYQHAESFPVQWVCEWGVPVTLTALLSFAWLLRPKRVLAPGSNFSVALALGVAVLLAQNLLDLALELTGVAVALVTALGALWGHAQGRRREGREVPTAPRHQLTWTAAFGASLAVTFTASLAVGMKDVEFDRTELSHAYASATQKNEPAAFEAVLVRAQEAIRRHPADPFGPLVAGVAASRIPGSNPVPWIVASLERDIYGGRAHLVLAALLQRQGALKQALLELRLALEAEPNLLGRATSLAVDWVPPDSPLLWRVVPENEHAAGVMEALAKRLPATSKQRVALLERSVAKNPKSASARKLLGETLLADLGATSPVFCGDAERARCRATIEEQARHIAQHTPGTPDALMLRAKLAALVGEVRQAEQMLAAQCHHYPHPEPCGKLRVDLAIRLDDPIRLEDAGNAYLDISCDNATRCARSAGWIGDRLGQQSAWSRAKQFYRRAVQEMPSSENWTRFARASWKAGQPQAALEALRQAEALAANAGAKNAVRKLRAQIATSKPAH